MLKVVHVVANRVKGRHRLLAKGPEAEGVVVGQLLDLRPEGLDHPDELLLVGLHGVGLVQEEVDVHLVLCLFGLELIEDENRESQPAILSRPKSN